MLDQSQDSDVVEDDFNKPVESIMRCEDFKSNFARKLSNRYISWTPGAKSKDSALKLCQTDTPKINVPERIEQCSQLSASIMEQNGEVVKPPDKTIKNNDIHNTELNALNMEVDTLRWQLAQTETNRQMHIALLKQIVTFLNRVKEHIECQKTDLEPEELSNIVQKSNLDLPRSKSVFHVDKSVEYSISPTKKISTKKISKSINNVNGFKECNHFWGHPKLPLVSENEIAKKLSEEMSRLITLANTVLSTKLPDLTCTVSVNGNEHYLKLIEEIKIVETVPDESFTSQDCIVEKRNESDTSSLNYNSLSFTDFSKDTILGVIQAHIPNNTTQAPFNHILRNDSIRHNDTKISQSPFIPPEEKSCNIDKKSEFNPVLNFIEDESGFSSMNSFQEIGIPIISIIPPSPSKDIAYMDEFPDVNETEKWKTDSIEFDKQSVKVFWV
ncbi:uncharacterized protein LOC111000942 [Pieris rapae]|uniref:uncharacterized protein LOC111000942 n=1 Tax=Pieris rapae TaxID=64459 RepID=UPI000B92CFB3|nr:uncharacterized protein LOC111000942 [Pieris rapae]